MMGMQLWLSVERDAEEWKLPAVIEQHKEGRMVFELAEGAVDILALLVQPPPSFTGEMSACGFEIS